jgi:ribonuclease HI
MTRSGRSFQVWCDAAWRPLDGIWALAYSIWENEVCAGAAAFAGFGLGLHDSNACELAACAASLKALPSLGVNGGDAAEITVHSDNALVLSAIAEPYRQYRRIGGRNPGFAIALETVRRFMREFSGVLKAAHVRAHQPSGLSPQTDRNRDVDGRAKKESKRLLSLMPPGPWSDALKGMSVRDPSFGGLVRAGEVHLVDISHLNPTIEERS